MELLDQYQNCYSYYGCALRYRLRSITSGRYMRTKRPHTNPFLLLGVSFAVVNLSKHERSLSQRDFILSQAKVVERSDPVQ
jgi:hypothetical protein